MRQVFLSLLNYAELDIINRTHHKQNVTVSAEHTISRCIPSSIWFTKRWQHRSGSWGTGGTRLRSKATFSARACGLRTISDWTGAHCWTSARKPTWASAARSGPRGPRAGHPQPEDGSREHRQLRVHRHTVPHRKGREHWRPLHRGSRQCGGEGHSPRPNMGRQPCTFHQKRRIASTHHHSWEKAGKCLIFVLTRFEAKPKQKERWVR